MTISDWHPLIRQIFNWTVTIGSVFLCLLLLPTRLPGMELLGIAPNWLLIWVVTWSVKRTAIQGASAGLILGLLQDGMTSSDPTHTLSLMLVGILTARLQKQRYITEDFISIALIVFGMAALAETVTALQFSFMIHSFDAVNPAPGDNLQENIDADSCTVDIACSINATPNLAEIWMYYQRIALASAILSSLWAPVIYYPLNRWWEWLNLLEPRKS